MKVTYIAEGNLLDRDEGSGTDYWIPICLRQAGIEVDIIQLTMPRKLLPPFEEFKVRAKQFFSRWSKKGYFEPDLLVRRAQYIAKTLEGPLSHLKSDVILTALSPLAGAYLQAKQPIVLWTDFVYSACAGFYPNFRSHHLDYRWDAHHVTDACLMNANLLIFSSQWAARSAIELHGISPQKIQVVPFGPNLDIMHEEDDVKTWVTARAQRPIKLLFVGKNWFRKGGDVVLLIAKRLTELGHAVKVTLVGSTPHNKPLPDYVSCIDFVSKNSAEGRACLMQLYRESHFLFVPSRAETFGIVFCEASAFGVPSITTFVGGIPEVIKNGINGMAFSRETTIGEYCDSILSTLDDPAAYQALCLSSFNEYKTRLNWALAGQQVKALLASLVK